jgi:putative membrane protein
MNRAAFLAGLALLAVIWGGPLLTVWRDSFSAHMLAHMGVVALAAPLLAIGLQDRFTSLSMPGWMPITASLVDLMVVWSWHMPVSRALAEASTAATVIEQLMFLGAGMFLWITCLQQPAGDLRSAAVGAFSLLFTSIHMTLLGALLALAPRPLYGGADVTCFGTRLSAGEDQAIGGVLMLLIGAAVYLAGGLFLLVRILRDTPAATGERR